MKGVPVKLETTIKNIFDTERDNAAVLLVERLVVLVAMVMQEMTV